jgi:conjugative relaxase-like TrwC/TraI family protein
VLRVTTLKAAGPKVARLIDYYVGLAEDQHRRDGLARGPVDYYFDPDEPPGRWWGSGCDAVGLGGEVEPGQLRRMLDARHPHAGRVLGRSFGDASARGFDATFSAPKSVSVLWALSSDPWVRAEVLAAHDTAVTATLEWVEQHGAVTRRGKDGIDQVDARGLVVALFRQHTSRTADPQLHTHAIIWSKVQDPTGRWLALDARWLKYQQRAIGWVYDAALRVELSARLGVAWERVVRGQSDIVGIPEPVRQLFSQRSTQVENKLTELIRRWADEHHGNEPDPRTIARLERYAVTDSRPAKLHQRQANGLRVEWLERADAAGLGPLTLPGHEPSLPGIATGWGREAVVTEALQRVTAESSTWLPADLAREIATLVPPDAADTGADLVTLVDELAATAAARCIELHPPSLPGVALRADGRPVSEHVVDRQLTTEAVLVQEHRLVAWARSAVRQPAVPIRHVDAAGLDEALATAARGVAGNTPLVLVIGPAGAGKTTMLSAAVAALASQGRPLLGLAPSAKAADVLAREAGCPTMTLAKLLADGERPDRLPPAGATVILDEAGMATTDDIDRLVGLAARRRWRLACVGDPDQLPAVGRGGMFAYWCDTLPGHRLQVVRRFKAPWEAQASLGLRAGDPRALEIYAAHRRLHTTHPALVAEQVARYHTRLASSGDAVAITTATTSVAREINRAIQHREDNWRHGPSVRLHDGTRLWAGDRIATRRNHPNLVTTAGLAVRNRQTWDVTAVRKDGGLVVADPDRGQLDLRPDYVASEVELGWAVTGYGNQGITVNHGICVVEPTSRRADVYVGMTRGRDTNVALVIDPTGTQDPAEALASIIRRPDRGLIAHAVRDQLYGHPLPDRPDEIQRVLDRLDRLERTRPAPEKGLGLM